MIQHAYNFFKDWNKYSWIFPYIYIKQCLRKNKYFLHEPPHSQFSIAVQKSEKKQAKFRGTLLGFFKGNVYIWQRQELHSLNPTLIFVLFGGSVENWLYKKQMLNNAWPIKRSDTFEHCYCIETMLERLTFLEYFRCVSTKKTMC